MKKLKLNKAFWGSAIYVGLGTVAVCSIYPEDLLYGEWSLWLTLLTFPVTLLSFGYRYAESEPIYPVFIIQFLMFIVLWLLLNFVFFKPKQSSI